MPKQETVAVRQILNAGITSIPLFVNLLKAGVMIQGVDEKNQDKVEKWLVDNKVGKSLKDLIAVSTSRSAFDTSSLDKALQNRITALTKERDGINTELEKVYGKGIGYRLHAYFHDDTKAKAVNGETPKAEAKRK